MPRKKKIPFANLEELHMVANATLRLAITNERYKRWSKVVENYKRLIEIVGRDNLPDDYEPPASYGLLMYEVHYHLGVALQHLGEHKKAMTHFTQAIDAVSRPKNGCLAGCCMNTCLMTPLHARRAFAYAKIGNLPLAMRDAERAVVLDSTNPDVFCVRALTRSSRDEEPLAIRDADAALRLKPDHLGGLVVRGSLSRPLYAEWNDLYQHMDNEFHQKAALLNPDTKTYLSVVNFKHPLALEFYNRFFHNLSVPHTVTLVDLTPDKPSKKQLETNQALYRTSSSRTRVQSASSQNSSREPFKCGTPTPVEINKTTALRRHDYGDAVRTHVGRPKTAHEYLAQLYKALEQKEKAGRSQSIQSSTSFGIRSSHSSPISLQLKTGSRNPSIRMSPEPLKTTKPTRTKTFTIESPSKYTIPVFQPLNIKGAPRMYYRPWKGDRLPTAEIARRKSAPAFY